MIYDENFIWTTHAGKQAPLKDLEDSHLANILDWWKQNDFEGENPLYPVVMKLIKERGLTQEYLDRAQIPYKNENDKWEICKDHQFIEVQE